MYKEERRDAKREQIQAREDFVRRANPYVNPWNVRPADDEQM